MTCSNNKVTCLECEDYGRASLAQEIAETLRVRGHFVPSMDYHNKRQTCDLIGYLAQALDRIAQQSPTSGASQ